MKNVIVLSGCNQWKEHSSAHIIGVFNDEEKLKKVMEFIFT